MTDDIIVSANYNKVAWIYNGITRFVSMGGNTRSQCYFLKHVDKKDTVLNIGCGSIGFNTELARACENVTAVDIAPNMIRIAEKYIRKQDLSDHVTFVCSDIMNIKPEKTYDTVMAGFFLNTFNWNDCVKVMTHITGFVKPGGFLCIADEARGTRLTTKTSLFLFRPLVVWLHRMLAKQPLHQVYDYEPPLKELGFEILEQERDPNDYILSTVYRKT